MPTVRPGDSSTVDKSRRCELVRSRTLLAIVMSDSDMCRSEGQVGRCCAMQLANSLSTTDSSNLHCVAAVI